MIRKARENFYCARVAAGNSFFNSAMSRLYYCMYQSAMHYLDQLGEKPEDYKFSAWNPFTEKYEEITDSKWNHTNILVALGRVLGRKAKTLRSLRDAKGKRTKADYREDNIQAQEFGKFIPEAENWLKLSGTVAND